MSCKVQLSACLSGCLCVCLLQARGACSREGGARAHLGDEVMGRVQAGHQRTLHLALQCDLGEWGRARTGGRQAGRCGQPGCSWGRQWASHVICLTVCMLCVHVMGHTTACQVN